MGLNSGFKGLMGFSLHAALLSSTADSSVYVTLHHGMRKER